MTNVTRAFSPKNNETSMAAFQEGAGKSASFFFFTENSQFVIKTLKDEELSVSNSIIVLLVDH